MFKWIKKLFTKKEESIVSPKKVIDSIPKCTPVYVDNIGTLETLDMRVIRLRRQGKTQKEIAAEIGKTENQTKYIINKLIKQGMLERKTCRN